MKYAALLILAAPAFAQISSQPSPAAASMPPSGAARPIVTQAKAGKIPLGTLVSLERAFDGKLAGIADSNNTPIDLFGATRGIYLDGYGIVFTTEMGLVVTPTINPFNSTITDAHKTRIHTTKLARLPLLKKVMTEMMRNVATTLVQVPDNQQVVVAVRLDYLNWEITSGLPGLVVAKADRRSALAGNIQVEEQ
jgi:hypothetical protein